MTEPAPEGAAIFDRRALAVGAGCMILAAAAAGVSPHRRPNDFTKMRLNRLLPSAVGMWRRLKEPGEIIAEALDDASANAAMLLARFAASDSPEVMVALSYQGPLSHEVKTHRPEVCYRSAGFSLSHQRDIDFPPAAGFSPAGRSFFARRGSRAEQVAYWTRIGDAFPRTSLEQGWVTLVQRAHQVAPDGLLMRFSCLTDEAGVTIPLLTRFAQDLFIACDLPARRVLRGVAS